jgi:hypothetical protein
LLFASCWSGGGDEPSLDCGEDKFASEDAPTARAPEDASIEAADLLEQYERASYTAEYDFCVRSSGRSFTGSAIWSQREAQARMVLRENLEAGKVSSSTFAIASGNPRAALCSEDLGSYFAHNFGLSGGDFPDEEIPFPYDALFALGATCIDYRFEEASPFQQADGIGLAPPSAAEVRGSGDRSPGPAVVVELPANGDGRCVVRYRFRGRAEFCFSADGILLSSTYRSEEAVQRIVIRRGSIRSSSDEDFELPYAVVPSPEECPYETPWAHPLEVPPPTARLGDTPPEDVVLQYRDALVRYLKSSYTVDYQLCHYGGEGTQFFQGTMKWRKDGSQRARYDIQSLDGVRSAIYVAQRGGPTYWCSEDLGKEVRFQVDGSDREDIHVVKQLRQAKEGCVVDSKQYRSCYCVGLDNDVINPIGLFFDPITYDIGALEGGVGDGLRLPGLRREERVIAGLDAECYDNMCFGPEGQLLSIKADTDFLIATSVGPPPPPGEVALPYPVLEGLPPDE